MHQYPPVIYELITKLAELPTIGPKTAERIVFMMLKKNNGDITALGNNLIELSKRIKRCSQCHNFAENDPCHICNNEHRDDAILCIVSEPQDLVAIERTGHFNGKYFVLNGNISTYHGITPQDINVPDLVKHIKNKKNIKEIILALDPNVEGETTAMYLIKHLEPLNKKISRLAKGLPVGADVEYADEVTLSAALDNRKEIS